MLFFTEQDVQRKRSALTLSKHILGGKAGIAEAIDRAAETVEDWCSHPDRNRIPYSDCITLSRLTGINISDFAPDKIKENAEINEYRLLTTSPPIEVQAKFLAKRTLFEELDSSQGQVILAPNYFLITGLLRVQKYMEFAQKKVSAILLDFKTLLLQIKPLDSFNTIFSTEERLAIGVALHQQWLVLSRQVDFELRQNPLIKKIKAKLAPNWDPFVGEKTEIIATIIGVEQTTFFQHLSSIATFLSNH